MNNKCVRRSAGEHFGFNDLLDTFLLPFFLHSTTKLLTKSGSFVKDIKCFPKKLVGPRESLPNTY